jgi:TM2 domain-containing membrane protein YozV
MINSVYSLHKIISTEKMKKAVSVYVISAFLLMSFTGCGKLMNSIGLNQSEPSAPPEVVNQTDTFNEAKIPQQVEASEASKLSQISEPAKSTQETKLTPSAQASEPSNTSIKNLTAEEILELAVETLERKLALLNPVDSDDVEELQVVIDRRKSLVAQLMDVKRGYYDYLSKVRPNEEILGLAKQETVKILERELKLFNPKGFYNSKKRQAAIDHSNSLIAQLMDVKRGLL